MSTWYDQKGTIVPDRPVNVGGWGNLYGDSDRTTTENGTPDMPKFERSKALEVMLNGTDEAKRALVDEISFMLEHKPYGLVWERGGTSTDSTFEIERVVEELSDGIPYPVYRDELSTNPERADGNMLLEGDNYVWLKMLEQTHGGGIDVIYIDPPYNTGNKDFRYNDAYVDQTDTFRHSKWLDFMDKRLKVARNLLADDGVIFISISQHELAQLIMLCDEVFEEHNRISIISVELANTGGLKLKPAQEGNIVKNTEWILVYCKNYDNLMSVRRTPLYDYRPGYDTHYSNIIVDGKVRNLVAYYNELHPDDTVSRGALSSAYESNDTFRKFVREYASDIFTYSTCAPAFSKKYHVHEEYPCYVVENNKEYIFQKKNNRVVQLFPLDKSFGQCDDIKNSFGLRKIRGDLWKEFDKDMSNVSKEGWTTFKNGKKPARLIEQLCKWAVGSKKDAVILDFFAGSGTTAQSVEQLNQKDGGCRKWILVTNNEDQESDDANPETGICRDVTKPRIDTFITGVRPDGKPYGAGGVDSGYKYFQYKFIPRIRRQYERNSHRFFQPYIVDAMTMLKYGVQRVVQDEREMLCVYSNDTLNIISFYADSTLEQVDAAIQRYVDDSDEKKLMLFLPEDSSHFSEIRGKYVGSSVEVSYQHALLRTADYLE